MVYNPIQLITEQIMAFSGKAVVRVVFAICIVLIFLGDYTGLVEKLLGNTVPETNTSNRPKRTNFGYGDTKPEIDLDADIEDDTVKNLGSPASKSQILSTIKNACLPKLICELNATPEKEKLTESEKSLLSLIRDTSISTTAELTSKYHFAAHMGQLIAGIDGNGCHNFYPSCPFPGLQVLQIMKKFECDERKRKHEQIWSLPIETLPPQKNVLNWDSTSC